jgi:hypothetical protein
VEAVEIVESGNREKSSKLYGGFKICMTAASTLPVIIKINFLEVVGEAGDEKRGR